MVAEIAVKGRRQRISRRLLMGADGRSVSIRESEQQVRGAPAFSRIRITTESDQNRERELHDYYGSPYYWG